jgi:hypothetical protein
LAAADEAGHRHRVNALLVRTSELVRAGSRATRVDHRGADLGGADLRGADLGGADLSGSLFVTRPQLAAAKGGDGTRIPPSLARPEHWPPAATPGG